MSDNDDGIIDLNDEWFEERKKAKQAQIDDYFNDDEFRKEEKSYGITDIGDADEIIINKPIKTISTDDDVFKEKIESEDSLRKSIKRFRKNNINHDEEEYQQDYDQYVLAYKIARKRRDLIESTPLRDVNSPGIISETKTKTGDGKQYIDLFNKINEREEDIDFLTPVKRCASLGHDHIPRAIAICKTIINRISDPENCINIITRWQRSRLMPNIDEETEDRFIIAHMVLSDIKLEVMTRIGYILFDSITNIYDMIHPELYANEEYSVSKHRFAIPNEIMVDDESHQDQILAFLRSTCFYEPRQTNASDNNTEVINFAHNDILHEYSGHMRNNFVYAQIYFKLRLRMGDEMEFKKKQLAFKRTLDFIVSVIYNHKKYMTIPFETVECIIHLSEIITNIDIYTIMTRNIYQFYKEIDLQRRKEIIELCESNLPSSKIQRVI